MTHKSTYGRIEKMPALAMFGTVIGIGIALYCCIQALADPENSLFYFKIIIYMAIALAVAKMTLLIVSTIQIYRLTRKSRQ